MLVNPGVAQPFGERALCAVDDWLLGPRCLPPPSRLWWSPESPHISAPDRRPDQAPTRGPQRPSTAPLIHRPSTGVGNLESTVNKGFRRSLELPNPQASAADRTGFPQAKATSNFPYLTLYIGVTRLRTTTCCGGSTGLAIVYPQASEAPGSDQPAVSSRFLQATRNVPKRHRSPDFFYLIPRKTAAPNKPPLPHFEHGEQHS